MKKVIVKNKKSATKKSPPSSTRAKARVAETTLTLSTMEVIFLRDLMSVLFPADLTTTVSTDLAEKTERTAVEETLWSKVAGACESLDVSLGEEAPDYVIAPVSAPLMGVFELPKNKESAEGAGISI